MGSQQAGREWFFRQLNRVAWAGRFLLYPVTTPEFRQRMRRKMVQAAAVDRTTEELPPVVVMGCPHAASGMAEACRSSVRALDAANIEHEVIDVGIARGAKKELYPAGDEGAVNLIHINAAEMDVVRMGYPSCFQDGCTNIGFWYWELPEFPSEWQTAFTGLKEVWTASAFCQDAMAKVSPVPVVKIPPCLPPLPESIPAAKTVRARFGIPEDCYAFFCMADALSTFERKNPQGVLDAYLDAFEAQDERVCLVVKLSNASRGDSAFVAQLKAAMETHSVLVIEEFLERDELTALQAAVDCFVSLHRSEGYGLPLAEEMRLGKPCIATGWSGNLEFMTPWNSFLVDYDLVKLPQTIGEYAAGCTWAEPRLKNAAEYMQLLAEDPDAGVKVGERGRIDVRVTEPSYVGELIEKRLQWVKFH